MSHTGHLCPSNFQWPRPTGRSSKHATILEIGNKRMAALHAALYGLETKFKKRTVEFEMQVTAQRNRAMPQGVHNSDT